MNNAARGISLHAAECLSPELTSIYGVLNAVACYKRNCALCALTAFSVRIKSMRTENSGKVKTRTVWFLIRIVDCARMAFYPCPINDRPVRLFVRATSQFCNNGERDLSRHV